MPSCAHAAAAPNADTNAPAHTPTVLRMRYIETSMATPHVDCRSLAAWIASRWRFATRSHSLCRDSQIRFRQSLVRFQLARGSGTRNLPELQHVCIRRVLQRDSHVLLDDEHGRAGLGIDLAQNGKDVRDDLRGEAKRRLVEQ